VITCYEEFIATLTEAGFSMGGGNAEGIYSVIPWSWNEEPPYQTPVRWHTGDPKTDPWEWRMRVLEERDDIAYAKLFFKKSGYITAAWYPYFLAVRRRHESFADAYQNGTVSHEAKRVYDVVAAQDGVPLHTLRLLSGMQDKESKARFDRALTVLQTRMFITMCARQKKLSQSGEAYGWFSTVFTTVERYFPEDVFQKAACLNAEDAANAIKKQILKLNASAAVKTMDRFIKG